MDDIYEIRRRNMRALMDRPPLSGYRWKREKAAHLDMSQSMLSQVMSDGYRIGDDKAREIERILGLPENWMDNAHGTSQDVILDPAMIQETLVSLEKGIRDGLHLEFNVAFLGRAFIMAYEERLDSGPEPLNESGLRMFDKLVLGRLRELYEEDRRRPEEPAGRGEAGSKETQAATASRGRS